MKLVVIGGTGLIGSRVVTHLRDHGDDAVAASPDTGVNTLTGQGLAEVLEGAAVVIDVSNSPSFEEKAVMNFFTPHVLFQPMAADDVAKTVASVALGAPLNGTVEVGGPH
jgi:uncharacterized protein YbjT (DUF2867 family)